MTEGTDPLQESLHAVAEPALDRLARRGPLIRKVTNVVETDATGRVRRHSLIGDDYASALLIELGTMLDTPELAAQLTAVADAVERDAQAREILPAELKGHPACPEKRVWVATYVVMPFLLHLIEQWGGLWYKESWFEFTYQALRAYLAADTWPAMLLAPLDNFSAEFDDLALGEQVSLVRLSQAKKQELWQDHGGVPGLVPGLLPTELLGWTHAVRAEIAISRGCVSVTGAARRFLDDVLTVLRLYGPHNLGATVLKVTLIPSTIANPDLDPDQHHPFNPDAFGQGALAPLPRRPTFSGPKYLLGPADGDALRDLYARYLVGPAEPAYRLAVRRFNLANDRASDEDRLLDYWIAFETLFAPDSTQEIRFRAALRIARFVGQLREDRERLFEELKASYNLRSDVIHGGLPASKRRAGTPEVVGQTRTILREALRLWLDPMRSHQLADIDAAFLA